jgi:hypothetical protein
VGGRTRGPTRVTERVEFGLAELLPDADRPTGWMLLLDGSPQSYVDVDDPTRLEFEYVRHLAAVVDTVAPAGAPPPRCSTRTGALTLPRYVAATRPGAVQRVVERDAALTALVRRVLPLPRGTNLRVRAADARAAVEATGPGRFDVVVNDVYSGRRMPGRLATTRFAAAVARVLRPGGFYAVNLADGAPLRFTPGQVATLRAVFADVCLIADPAVLRGRRFANLVLVAVAEGGALPVTRLAAAAAADPLPARLLHGGELDRLVSGARPVTDEAPADSPEPPPQLFARYSGVRRPGGRRSADRADRG